MHQSTIFKLNYILFLTLINGILPYEFADLDNLGEQITRNVNRNLAPLQNLGARIEAQVNHGLELNHLSNQRLHSRMHQNMNQLNDLSNLGDRISAQVNEGVAPLKNLGQQIEESVYQGLEPVRALEITFHMKGGIGGTTIATHLPEGQKFLIRNNQMYVCDTSISDDDGVCSGTLTPFQINSKKDYCYLKNGYSRYNNYICIGANSITVINNNIICNSNTGTPALLLTVNEYNKLCKEVSEKVTYKYTANPSDPAHVEIPNKNKYVKCTNNQPGVCIFSESHSLPQYSGNTIFTNNNNIYSSTYYKK